MTNETPRPGKWCPTCRNRKLVEGTTVYKGQTFKAMVPCPACVGNPATQLKLPEVSSKPDHAERAAGDKKD